MKFKTLKILAATAVLAGSMQTVSAKVKTVEKFTTVTESATIVAIDQINKRVTLKGPEGNTQTVKVSAKSALTMVGT